MDSVILVISVLLACMVASIIGRRLARRRHNGAAAFAALHFEAIRVAYRLDNEIAQIYGTFVDELEFTSSHPRLQAAYQEVRAEYEAQMNAAISRARLTIEDLHKRAADIGFLDLIPKLLAEHGALCPSLRFIVAE